jgi:hypothetical protein
MAESLADSTGEKIRKRSRGNRKESSLDFNIRDFA